MKFRFIIFSLLAVVFLGACSGESTGKSNDSVNIKDLVEDYSVGNIQDQSASITSTELIVTNDDHSELVYELPEDEFFVSIAPFISETHECSIHSLTGCQGEVVHQEMDVYIEDMNGQVILDDKMNSRANGFLDLWLPRDQEFNVKITYDGKETESVISTFENDKTCITTMQLT